MSEIAIRQANEQDVDAVVSILTEAAAWLTETGRPMWRGDELRAEIVEQDIRRREFFLASIDDVPAGTIKFQLSDRLFWPDVPDGDSAFVHRLAVRRRFAGIGLAATMLQWATDHARSLGLGYLRLDCEAHRTKLRSLYESCGFRHHSDVHVGPYFVSRYERPL